MTDQEKFKAIMDRVPKDIVDENFTPAFLSIMTIHNYLDRLHKEGLIHVSYSVTPKGKAFAALCEEFDWQPTNQIINMFVAEMVDEEMQDQISQMIYRFRDDRDGMLEDIRNFKKKNP